MNTRSIMIDLPETVTISAPTAKGFSTENWTAEFVLECALHGIKQRRSDKYSTEKKDKEGALAKLDARILAGEVLSSGERGPSGPRDADAKADSDWLASKGYKGAIKELTKRWNDYVRDLLIKKSPGLAKVERRDELEAEVEANLEHAQEMVRATMTWRNFRGLMEDEIEL